MRPGLAVLISRYLALRRGDQPPGGRWSGLAVFTEVGTATVGVAGFLVVRRPSGGHADVQFDVLLPLAIGLVVVTGGCPAVAARNQNLRPLALALACGVNYGVAAFAVKLVTAEFGGGLAKVFTNWPIYVLAVVGPVGFILNQDAFQQGTFLAPIQATVSTADPVISIGLGVLWLGVVLRNSPGGHLRRGRLAPADDRRDHHHRPRCSPGRGACSHRTNARADCSRVGRLPASGNSHTMPALPDDGRWP
jgi:hypothetical protein